MLYCLTLLLLGNGVLDEFEVRGNKNKKILIEHSVNGMKSEVIVMSFRSLMAFSALQSWIPQVFRAFTVQLSSSVHLNGEIHSQGKIYGRNIWKPSPEFIDETFQISIWMHHLIGKTPYLSRYLHRLTSHKALSLVWWKIFETIQGCGFLFPNAHNCFHTWRPVYAFPSSEWKYQLIEGRPATYGSVLVQSLKFVYPCQEVVSISGSYVDHFFGKFLNVYFLVTTS